MDWQRPDAVRILDFPHTAEHVAQAGQALFGEGSIEAKQWLEAQLHELRHGEPDKVLAKMRGLRDDLAGQGEIAWAKAEVVSANLNHLEKRRDQIRYREFVSAGYPIGSGIVESGNKVVVEARMKGAGMHWAGEHVDGMVALRDALCSGRWDEAWGKIGVQLRQEAQERAEARRRQRRQNQAVRAAVEPPTALVSDSFAKPVKDSVDAAQNQASTGVDRPSRGPGRPSADHPWRRFQFGQSLRQHPSAES